MLETKKVDYSLMLDYYGDMLTPYQKEVLRLYYDCDMSYAEVAEEIGVTRQGARDIIARGSKKLSNMEEKLGLVARIMRLMAELDTIIATTDGEIKKKLIDVKKMVGAI